MLNVNKIRHLRKAKVFTQVEMSKKLKMSKATYGNLEQNGNFRVKDLIKLANILDVDICDLFENEVTYTMDSDSNAVAEPAMLYGKDREIYYLNAKIHSLEKEVKDKEEIIQLLKKQKK